MFGKREQMSNDLGTTQINIFKEACTLWKFLGSGRVFSCNYCFTPMLFLVCYLVSLYYFGSTDCSVNRLLFKRSEKRAHYRKTVESRFLTITEPNQKSFRFTETNIVILQSIAIEFPVRTS